MQNSLKFERPQSAFGTGFPNGRKTLFAVETEILAEIVNHFEKPFVFAFVRLMRTVSARERDMEMKGDLQMNATLQEPDISENVDQQPSVSDNVQETHLQGPTVDVVSVQPHHTKPGQTTVAVVIPPPSAIKTLNKGRFATGLLLSSSGVGLLLFVAVGMLQQFGLNGWFSLPIVAITAIGGIMMLGGGFGLMATAAPSLDDGEFERLMEAGNISDVCQEHSEAPGGSSDAQHRTDVPTGGSGEQRDADEV